MEVSKPRRRSLLIKQFITSIVWLSYVLVGQPTYSKENCTLLQKSTTEDSVSLAGVDTIGSLKKSFTDRVKKIAEDGFQKSKADYQNTKESYHREAVMVKIGQTINEAKEFLRLAPDTIAIMSDIRTINERMEIASDGIFTNQGMSQTYRNLTASSLLMRELLYKAEQRQSQLESYKANLKQFKITFDSLNADSLLYIFPDDSATLMKFVKNLSVVTQPMQPVDSTLRATLINLEELEIPVYLTVTRLRSYLEQIEGYQKDLAENQFRREIYNLWSSKHTSRSFMDIVRSSAIKAWYVLRYYVPDRPGRIILVCVLVVMTSLFIRTLRLRQKEEGNFNPKESGQLVLRYPFLSALIINISVFQFIFDDPPFVFNSILWVIAGISLTFIFWSFITRYWLIMWMTMIVVFLLASADNLILQSSRPERLGMLIVSTIGIAIGLLYLFGGHLHELRERYIVYFLQLMVVLELISLIANLYGRYNFSKSMFIAGFANVVIGIVFLWTIRLVQEIMDLASKSYKRPDGKLFYINFDKVGNKVPTILYVLLVLGWTVQIGSNFYAYKQITTPLRDFLLSERTIGSYTFSLESALIFMVILIVSLLLSKLVSYFSPDVHHSEDMVTKPQVTKVGLGSWLLLVRIFIICVGLFLAFAAAGIPMDRITIILGALGVGIGLGLQGLFNNLVSGLIIAFEKPVNVGDVVEVDENPGVMKSIGFRSSVIVKADGSQVVVPNGDLLNLHLVNWSNGTGKRRVELLVGVAYGTNLEKTRDILIDILKQNKMVLSAPPPMVLAQDFKDSCIEFRCNFWVGNFMEGAYAKSEIIRAIVIAFKENGIEIPFPQRDLHIKEYPAGNSPDTNFK